MKRPTASLPVSLALALPLLVAAPARAVDNSKHVVGLGALTQFSFLVPAANVPAQLSAKLALQPRIETWFLFGMAAGDGAAFLPGLKLAYVFIPEQHMNLYAALGFSLDLRTRGGLEGFLYQLGPGVELFFPEFPNLGLAFEFGLGGYVHADGGSPQGFATTGSGTGTVGTAGIHYYF